MWPLAPLGGAEGAGAQLAARLDERVAMVDGRIPTSSVRGVVDLDGERAAGVWLSALETVRVRQLGAPVPLRFVRIVDGSLALVEPGRLAAPGPEDEPRFELTQPAGFGGMWSIEADAPTRVIIERVEERDPRYVAVEVEHDVLEWIAEGGAGGIPSLLEPDEYSRNRLRFDAALAGELLALDDADPALERALEAWRMLAAMAVLDRRRVTVRPYYVGSRRDRLLPLADTRPVSLAVDEGGDYRLAEQPRRWTFNARGPGLLEISARTWAAGSADGAPLAPARLRVEAGGRTLAQVDLSDRPARHVEDPDAALPRYAPLLTRADEPVGELGGLVISLAPDEHEYTIELIGGPALIRIDRAQRHEATLASLRGWTPRKRARAAARALRKSKADGAAWVELLLAEQTLDPVAMAVDDPRIVALGELSPLLAAAILSVVANDPQLDRARLDALIEQVRAYLAILARDARLDPEVRAHLRTRWLELLRFHGRPELASRLIERVGGGADPIAELSVEGLRLLAELTVAAPSSSPEIQRSNVLALLELARSKAPADRSLRALSLRLWSEATIWSRRRPRPLPDAPWPFEPRQWLVPLRGSATELANRDHSWTQIVPGQPVRLAAELGSAPAGEGQRLRLLDVFVQTPIDDPAPVGLRVDDRRWWSPQLGEVVRHRVAVEPGVRELELDAPPDTVAWASLPPADLDAPEGETRQLARIERMWSLPHSHWSLPGPAVPGVVRLELRWPEDVPPRPVEIAIVEETEREATRERTILFDPRRPEAALGLDAVTPTMLVDDEALPIYGGVAASSRHDVSFEIAADVTALRFEVEDQLELLAVMSLRRSLRAGEQGPALVDADEPGGGAANNPRFDHLFGDLASLSGSAIEAELAALSRTLLPAPQLLEPRARRAALLLMIGETGLARADMIALADVAERSAALPTQRELAAALLVELEARMSALVDPDEIVVTGERPPGAELVEPAIAAVIADDRSMLEPWLASLAAGRRAEQLDDALALVEARGLELEGEGADARTLLLGQLARTHWLTGDLADDPVRAREAGRAWLELYGAIPGALGRVREPIAVAVAAVDPLARHLGDPNSDARDASVAYGLVAELLPRYGHTSVRRLAMLAALRSTWSTLNHSENNAGFERLELPVVELELSDGARVRQALLAAPWGDERSEQLAPNRKAVLAWDAEPGSIDVEVWCRRLRTDRAPPGADAAGKRARLQARVVGKRGTTAERSLEIGDGRLQTIALPVAAAGRTQLELELAGDPSWLCAWRAAPGSAASSSANIEPRRRAMWWTAAPGSPVEFTVLGPTTLQFESRAVVSSSDGPEPNLLEVEVQRLGGELERGQMILDGEPERAVITEQRRSFTVAHTNADVVVVPDPGPHRVTLRSADGRLLIRARMRRDRGEFSPPERVGIHDRRAAEARPLIDGLDQRALGLTGMIVARDDIEPVPNRIGTFDGIVRVGLDELDDAADLDVRFGVAAIVGWRRELIDDILWLRVAAQLRTREGSPVAGGGIVGVGAQVPRVGVRVTAELDALASSFAGRPEASLRVTGFIDRPTWLNRRLQLVPRLYAGWRWQSLTPERVAAAATPLSPHPRVYQRYIHDHPLLLRPDLALRYYPFSDLAVWTRAGLQPDSDLRSLDHIDLELGFDGIGRQPTPWVPIWALSYEASLRYDSLGVPFYVRHGVSPELGLAVWIADTVRAAVGVRYQVFVSAAAPVRNIVELWLRLDGVMGRRLRDFGPGDLWFREPWAPRSWGDHEHQARSTQARPRSR